MKYKISAIVPIAYIVLVALLDMKYTFATMPEILGRVAVPVSLFMDVQAADASWLGIGTIYLAISLVIYTVLGFIIDETLKK